jgi:hypothetical protein
MIFLKLGTVAAVKEYMVSGSQIDQIELIFESTPHELLGEPCG